MKNLKNLFVIFRTFTKRKKNAIKIISLSIGLSLGLILIAKIYFEKSYDSFFPDKERIYMVMSNISSTAFSSSEATFTSYIAANIFNMPS